MRYLTKIFLVCLLAFTVVLAMDLSRSGNDSIVRRTWGSSEATGELQSDEVMTKSFPPMLKVELDDVFRKRILEHIQKKLLLFREESGLVSTPIEPERRLPMHMD